MTAEQATELELLVDREGLGAVVATLSRICDDKAEHLRCNWQDEAGARVYDRAARALNAAEGKMPS